MLKVKNNIIFICLLTLIFSVVLVQIGALILGFELDFSRYFYWILLVFWAYSNIKFKLDSGITMKIALFLFVIGVSLTTLSVDRVAETIFRISFTGWIIGIGQALIEIRKENV